MLETHPCAITGCRQACPNSHLMCIVHFRMIPAPLQRELSKAFTRWRRAVARAARSRTQEAFDSIAELRRVQQMAIDAVMTKLVKRDHQRQEGQDPLPLKV